MRIEVKTDNHVIDSATIGFVTPQCFSVIINTEERWRTADFVESGDDYLTFGFYDNGEDSCLSDTVTLLAEDDDDKTILKRIYFLQHNKDQLWYIFLDERVYLI